MRKSALSRNQKGCRGRITLFIYESMDRAGGIQSIVARQVELLQNSAQKVFVICKAGATVHDLPRTILIDYQQAPGDILQQVLRNCPASEVCIDAVALSPEAAPLAYLLQQETSKVSRLIECNIVLTILHPRALMRETERRHVHLLNKIAAYAIGIQNLVFMNEQCRATHSVFLSRDLSACPIVPIPIDYRKPRWSRSEDVATLRIVLVGRIVAFKAYNFAIPGIVAQLTAQGLSVTCDIYGYGSEEDRLEKLIRLNGVEKQVKFKGTMPLEQFDEIVAGYDLFIGMGTAAVQSAQLGVPTLLAIVDEENGTYGFIDAAPFGNLGESDIYVPSHDLKAMIEFYTEASPEQRREISRRGIAYANRYVGDEYVEKLTHNSTQRTGIYRHLSGLYCQFYIWMARDNWLRRTVRFVGGKRAEERAR